MKTRAPTVMMTVNAKGRAVTSVYLRNDEQRGYRYDHCTPS